MAKAPSPARVEHARKQQNQEPMTVTWDGTSYRVRPGEITARQDRHIREVLGRSLFDIMSELDRGVPSLDAGVVLVWLARTQAGETVDLDGLMDQVTFDTILTLTDGGDPVDPPT